MTPEHRDIELSKESGAATSDPGKPPHIVIRVAFWTVLVILGVSLVGAAVLAFVEGNGRISAATLGAIALWATIFYHFRSSHLQRVPAGAPPVTAEPPNIWKRIGMLTVGGGILLFCLVLIMGYIVQFVQGTITLIGRAVG